MACSRRQHTQLNKEIYRLKKEDIFYLKCGFLWQGIQRFLNFYLPISMGSGLWALLIVIKIGPNKRSNAKKIINFFVFFGADLYLERL